MSALLIFTLAIVYCGLLLYSYQALANGARLGARYAAVRGSACSTSGYVIGGCPATSDSIQTFVRGQTPLLNSASITVTTTWSSSPTGSCSAAGTNAPHNIVCVSVSYPFGFSLPLLQSSSIPLASTSQMTIAQ
ncbi:MAG: pilus assembly protein [Candidatus Eremiobacteraeota bacterium]|nr:pilus assembly protein [Candidatus Eremiobacteraeota bacterium]